MTDNAKYEILNKVKNPNDLRKLNIKEKKKLADEIREFIIEHVSKTGGHLASNLGTVELTIALHSAFNTPRDKIVWDVGHQCYTHKILTGRKDKFDTLRQYDGLSGFPKTCESEYDVFNTGHSSTSISAALGIARARDIKKENYRVVAVIGDGALTGGMALEALNDAGVSKTDIIVILNDNEMSIEKNTGGLARALTKMRTRKFYTNSNKAIKSLVSRIPKVGNSIIKNVHIIKNEVKRAVLPNMMFEDLGFKYLGPVDGNDIDKVEALMKRAKDLSGPILIHCKTVKGKGYKQAEENPDKFHSIGKFDIETGESINSLERTYSSVFGDKIVEIAKENEKVVAITAAMAEGTGLDKFKKIFPKRFFDVEIAEQHAITMAAGLAINGCIPVVAMYSSFLQRAYDQVIHDVCMQNLHVVICLDRSGIVGNDGETHQGIFDLAFLRMIPNITIMAPKNFKELEEMMDFAINKMNSPVVIRYPKGSEDGTTNLENGNAKYYSKFAKNINNTNLNENKIELGKSEFIYNGNSNITIIGIGKMVAKAMRVSNILKEKYNIDSNVINARFLKPFDEKIIIDINNDIVSIEKSKSININKLNECNANKNMNSNSNESERNNNKNQEVNKNLIVTIEDGTLKGGLFTEVSEIISKNNLENIKLKGFGYDDTFVKQGSIKKLEEINNLSEENICNDIIYLHNI